MMTTIVQTTNLTKQFDQKPILDTINLDVPAGQLLGLLGPNGAGKTTLLDILMGVRRPSSGTAELFGQDPRSEAVRQRIGVARQQTDLPSTWRVGELVDFVAAHFADPFPVEELLDRFDLADLVAHQAGSLSGGQQRRVAVALAFAGRPELVFLDEPTTGLDVDARRGLWDGIRSFRSDGGTVIVTSHYIEEVEALADRVVVLDDGRILADGSLSQIRSRVRLARVTLTRAQLPTLQAATDIERDGEKTHVLTSDAPALVRELVTSGAVFDDIAIASASLEDAFLALTGDRMPSSKESTS